MTTQQTATDLRVAAHVAEVSGKANGTYMDGNGGVCLAGAVGLATGHATVRNVTVGGVVGLRLYTPEADHAAGERYSAALNVLAPMLPTDCGGTCGDGHPSWDPDSLARIYHYSDFICTGGAELADVLIQAAEKVEAGL